MLSKIKELEKWLRRKEGNRNAKIEISFGSVQIFLKENLTSYQDVQKICSILGRDNCVIGHDKDQDTIVLEFEAKNNE